MDDAPQRSFFDGMVLTPPIMIDEEEVCCELPSRIAVNFCQIMPIYWDERECLLNDPDLFIERLMDLDQMGVLDIDRESICDDRSYVDGMMPFTERTRLFWEWFADKEDIISEFMNDVSKKGQRHMTRASRS